MHKKRLQFIIASVLFFGILFLLPFIGNVLRSTQVRMYRFLENVVLSQESGALRNQLEEAKRDIASRDALLARLKSENEFLRERLGIKSDTSPSKLLLGLVVGQGSGFGEETLVINKGTVDGLGGGEAVIVSPDILIGVVDEVFRNRAIVRLIFDSNFTLKAKTISGIRGVLKGETGSRIIFDEVSQAAGLLKETLVVTDTQESKIPPNLPIGSIQEILSKPTDIFLSAEVKALFDSRVTERVFLILSPQ